MTELYVTTVNVRCTCKFKKIDKVLLLHYDIVIQALRPLRFLQKEIKTPRCHLTSYIKVCLVVEGKKKKKDNNYLEN